MYHHLKHVSLLNCNKMIRNRQDQMFHHKVEPEHPLEDKSLWTEKPLY